MSDFSADFNIGNTPAPEPEQPCLLYTSGDEAYPYGVPMSYGLEGNRLYFHCMPVGHKVDAMKRHDKVSFTVIETDQIVPEEYTTYFRSVIAFGKVTFIEEPDEKRRACLLYTSRCV